MAKKVIMNHALAKALMDAGMQHFDVGGTMSDAAMPELAMNKPIFQQMGSSDGSPFTPMGQFVQSTAEAFTPQDQYQAQLAPITQYNYAPAISQGMTNAQGGLTTNQNILGQQQSLANQLQVQSQGGGPNPALAQLNQTTGENTANQAALMAGQRGASANAGLMAREIAQQGAANQQNAVGQAATLRANQQLNSEQALANQQAEMQSANLGEQGAQNTFTGNAISGQNAQNNAMVSNYNQMQGTNAATAESNAKANQQATGGGMQGIGSLMSMMSKGGKVTEHLHEMAKIYHPNQLKFKSYVSGGKVPGKAPVKGDSPKNDIVPALLSPGETVLPKTVSQAANAPAKAKEFMEHLSRHSSEKDKNEKQKNDLHRVLKKNKGTLSDRLERLEKLCYGGMSGMEKGRKSA